MSKTKLVEAMRDIGMIATVRVPNEQHILRVIQALVDGGIRAVELAHSNIRSAGWLVQSLKESGLLVGIGAVTRSAQAREAGVFGADFITASVTTPDVVSACEEMKIPCILSGLTPTEVWRAHEMAADFVKITAAEALGGPPYIRSLRETLPTLQLVGADMPLEGYIPYLEAGVEVLEFRSSLELPRLAEREEWAEISRRASEIVSTRDGWRVQNR
ncbi:MAG: bifunctional 4-hydroxy-2-oxoglutarate aldolase/2-dehydro-3-deoxy-phosphogluconate aldolase [Actinomycetota bacterium]|nr:bifunctional 4-hydroxy-2-oxoglutarate aldolase/2-dehydro-3-deoxy-phosphogluconate aldolase [Actinomycetota bacterium]MDQ5817936.1 bifunctional 4-hydroxy-2-oxoglutarate aldolase/2-dehydro-3-deoxy-phosphogluconate aldolase [Actinomycetota bacterium]